MTKHISMIVGILRCGSFARKIAKNLLAMFPDGHEARIVEIQDLPLYDFDYDDSAVGDKPVPEEYTSFRGSEEIVRESTIEFLKVYIYRLLKVVDEHPGRKAV